MPYRPGIHPRFDDVVRRHVLWIGSAPDMARQAFEHVGLTVFDVGQDQAFDHIIREARAVVVDAGSEGLQWLQERRRILGEFLIHGLLFVPRGFDSMPAAKPVLSTLQPKLKDPSGREWYWDEIDAEDAHLTAALKVLQWDPGPAENPSLSVPSVAGISLEDETLLRRAFSDATSLQLSALSGGRSAHVFRVDAVINDPAATPLPFIVKLDESRKIRTEFEAYWNHVHDAVPFHLRPVIDRERSLLGFERGLIVSPFVSGALSLRDAAERGQAQLALYSLFDHAMATWHGSARRRNESAVDALVDCRKLSDRFAGSARQKEWAATGMDADVDSLVRRLRQSGAKAYLAGVTHGDLHAQNVQVRGGDAVLIDFYSCGTKAPVLFDAAYLEVTTAFSRQTRQSLGPDWVEAIRDLFSRSAVEGVPPLEQGPRSSQWLRNVIRQIRLFVFPMATSNEYSTLMAWALLRHGTFEPRNDEHENERREALAVASRLIGELA